MSSGPLGAAWLRIQGGVITQGYAMQNSRSQAHIEGRESRATGVRALATNRMEGPIVGAAGFGGKRRAVRRIGDRSTDERKKEF